MKKIIYLLMAVLFVACNEKVNVKLPSDLHKVPPVLPPDMQRPVQDFHKILYADAAGLINNFIATFSDDATKVALGGYVPDATLLKNLDGVTYQGVRMYYCRKAPVVGANTMFIATDNFNFDRYNPDFRLPDGASLKKSNNSFVYDRKVVAPSEVKKFLEEQDNECDGETETIGGKDVKNYNEKFKDHFNIDGFPANDNPYGFMVGREIDALLGQNGCKGFRFYWGLNPDINMNKIRIVIIGVGADNKNIIKNPDAPAQEALMLERSWPPY